MNRRFFDEFKSLLKSRKCNRRFNEITKLYRVLSKYRVIQNDCQGTIVQRQFRTKFGKQPPSDNFIRRRYAQFQETGHVSIRNRRYESEPPLKPSPLTCYKQFGTNSIIVLMFVESQRVHIQSTCTVCNINLECCSIK